MSLIVEKQTSLIKSVFNSTNGFQAPIKPKKKRKKNGPAIFGKIKKKA